MPNYWPGWSPYCKGRLTRPDAPRPVRGEIDWVASRDTMLRPDVIVVCGPEPTRHVERTPPSVVEILFETTRERDVNFNLQLYRELGVAWYLVVDPAAISAKMSAGVLRGCQPYWVLTAAWSSTTQGRS